MMAASGSLPRARGSGAERGAGPRPVGLLALADDGPVAELCRQLGLTPMDRMAAQGLGHALAVARPRLVVLQVPPAGPADIAVVAAERRRRPSMRAMLVDRPEAAEERLHALANGFDEALPDTIPVSELIGRARLLVSPSPRSGIVQVADGVELDLLGHQLTRDGVTVHLRPKEFGLLSLLAGHPGRVYTRRQLLERVWGASTPSDERTIDVHVRWLRSKIEPDPERPAHLVTVRGIGYRLDPSPALTNR